MYKNKLYKTLHTHDIKDHNLEYYHTKYPEWNREYQPKPMFDNIEAYQYHLPIQYLGFEDNLIQKAKNCSGNMVIMADSDYYQIMLEYIKCINFDQNFS